MNRRPDRGEATQRQPAPPVAEPVASQAEPAPPRRPQRPESGQPRPAAEPEILRPSTTGSHLVDFDHTRIEDVLRRASELGATTGVGVTGLDSATLVEIAAEVGIPADAVATALAEQRVGVDHDRSLLDRLVGPDEVWAERAGRESTGVTIERTAEWLERGHGLRPRMTADRVVIARRRDDVAARVHRSLRSVQGRGGLGKLREVRAVVVDVETDDDSVVAVAVLADLSDKRAGALVGGAIVSTVGSAVVVTTALVTSPLVLVALPAVAGAGLATSRLTFRSTLRRAQVAVDETVEHVVAGDDAPSLLRDLAGPLAGRLRRKR